MVECFGRGRESISNDAINALVAAQFAHFLAARNNQALLATNSFVMCTHDDKITFCLNESIHDFIVYTMTSAVWLKGRLAGTAMLR